MEREFLAPAPGKMCILMGDGGQHGDYGSKSESSVG